MSPKRPEGEGRLLQLVYYAYVAASAIARALPERVSYGLAHFFGGLAARRSKKRDVVALNLSRITGKPPDSAHVQRLLVDAYRSYARYWLETFALVREGREFFLERVVSDTSHRLHESVEQHGGCIVVVGHLGNWDAAGAWVGALGLKLVTVAEVLKPRRMFDFFVEHRARLGMTIYAAEKGVTEKLIEEVKGGAVVAILGDRDLKGTGPEVDFFGERATLPGGAAAIALKTDVPVHVASVYGERLPNGKRGWSIDISEPIDLPRERGPDAVVELTRRVGEKLEAYIARRPEEWHVFQPFWSADRAARSRSDAA